MILLADVKPILVFFIYFLMLLPIYFMLFFWQILLPYFLADVYAIDIWWMFLLQWSLFKSLLILFLLADVIANVLLADLIAICIDLLLALFVNWQMLLPFMWKMENHITYV